MNVRWHSLGSCKDNLGTRHFRVTNFTAGNNFHCIMCLAWSWFSPPLPHVYPVVSLFYLPHWGNHCLKTEYKWWNTLRFYLSQNTIFLPSLPVIEEFGPNGWWIAPSSLTVPEEGMSKNNQLITNREQIGHLRPQWLEWQMRKRKSSSGDQTFWLVQVLMTASHASPSPLWDDLHLIGHHFVFGAVISKRVFGRLWST